MIQIPIGLTSRCKKKVRVGTQESVIYYAHAVDLAFAIIVWKCQGGTFDYIIAVLEQIPGSSTLTFEKLYVMFTRVKKACKFQCLPLSPAFNKAKSYITYVQKFWPQNRDWILAKMGIGNHM